MNLKISTYNFKILLQDFSTCVQAQLYNRIPYEDWKTYCSLGDSGLVSITYDEIDKKIQIWVPNVINRTYFTFDESFGKFISFRLNSSDNEPKENSLLAIADGYLTTISDSNLTIASGDNMTMIDNKIEIKEKKMKGLNFDFGPCTGDNVRLSMYGIAIKNTSGTWVSYNKGDIVDVDVFNFDGGKFLFKMPVAIKDIAVGDIVVHNKVPMFVTSVENGVEVVDIRAGEKKSIIPTKNMFGFDFVTKIVSMFNAVGNGPTADQPFGNMLPFLMMEEGKEIDPMMMMLMMNGGSGALDMSNPMMMYFLMGDKGKDMLPLMMMMGGR